jgi:alcohol dehydrogenase class IV
MLNEKYTLLLPKNIIYGNGSIKNLHNIIKNTDGTVLILTGGESFRKTSQWIELISFLQNSSIKYYDAKVTREPHPEDIDSIVDVYRNRDIGAVISIGGGSVLDTGKAVSAMLTKNDSIVNYLEGVGTKEHSGDKIFFTAVPTTAGTGSEATKNAVITRLGSNGFKKSLRHDNFIADAVIIDPELYLNCPDAITLACAMDALTQLIESYVSVKSNPVTDALAIKGIELMSEPMRRLAAGKKLSLENRGALAQGAFLSGVTLANAGLGTVHGFASSIGGFFDISHGVVCGTLLGAVTEKTVLSLINSGDGGFYLKKYSDIYHVLSNESGLSDIEDSKSLYLLLSEWTAAMKLPRLSEYGVNEADFHRIIDSTENKNNPVKLGENDLYHILKFRL